MLRSRIALAALAAVAAMALSGCATFEDNDVVAKIDDVKLTEAELDRRAEARGLLIDGRVRGDAARTIITDWIMLQLAARADVLDAYAEGPVASDLLCIDVAVAPRPEVAEAWVERLESGESWTDVTAEIANDPRALVSVPCQSTEQLLGPEAQQLAGMSLDAPYTVFNDVSASLATRMRPIDELSGTELVTAAAGVEADLAGVIIADAASASIDVAPRFGNFDERTLIVTPLG